MSVHTSKSFLITVGGVNPMNKYRCFFALPQLDSTSHIPGSDTLRDPSTKCGAKCPALLRSTRLSKHIATMTQLMNLRENEMDVLVKYYVLLLCIDVFDVYIVQVVCIFIYVAFVYRAPWKTVL